jgi:hypothetical protein
VGGSNGEGRVLTAGVREDQDRDLVSGAEVEEPRCRLEARRNRRRRSTLEGDRCTHGRLRVDQSVSVEQAVAEVAGHGAGRQERVDVRRHEIRVRAEHQGDHARDVGRRHGGSLIEGVDELVGPIVEERAQDAVGIAVVVGVGGEVAPRSGHVDAGAVARVGGEHLLGVH